ncbi:hypothetical protein DY000_02021222 [Brassica cretica]|uniref:Uncharacterized protein n=1 Tax=Brassica cretica TaxID=69181 RepID=A0ABQ7EK42_BRACR|nr:hypothetical protein DY000_02021222 [Brassica cretica]
MSRVSSAKFFVRENLFRKSICLRKFSFSSSVVLNVNFVVTVFDPNNYDIIFYNEWLKVSFELTRFVDPDVIRSLGIKSDLEDLFEELGMGNMATNPQEWYRGVGNLRQRWYVDGMASMVFNHGVPMITL